MEDVMCIAAYVINKYHSVYGEEIDEMKLHKLMYFAQRESFIQRDEPLFDAYFFGWKYGPILKEIRTGYKDGTINSISSFDLGGCCTAILDKVFDDYAGKSSWSLSRLTHGELSWKNSRIGIPAEANSDNQISNDDIRADAERIKERREKLSKLGFT